MLLAMENRRATATPLLAKTCQIYKLSHHIAPLTLLFRLALLLSSSFSTCAMRFQQFYIHVYNYLLIYSCSALQFSRMHFAREIYRLPTGHDTCINIPFSPSSFRMYTKSNTHHPPSFCPRENIVIFEFGFK